MRNHTRLNVAHSPPHKVSLFVNKIPEHNDAHFGHDFNLLEPKLFFLILAHPVYKMWIIQEPNTLELWNKLHFEGEKTESIQHV